MELEFLNSLVQVNHTGFSLGSFLLGDKHLKLFLAGIALGADDVAGVVDATARTHINNSRAVGQVFVQVSFLFCQVQATTSWAEHLRFA